MAPRLPALALLLLLPLFALAQSPPVRWAINAYGPDNVEAFIGCNGCVSDQRAMGVDAAGNVIVAGYDTTPLGVDWKTVKFNGATGAVLWEKYFDSPVGGPDTAYAMTVDSAGNAIVTGYVWNGNDGDIKTIKYAAADGAIVWEKTLPGPAGGNDFGIAIAADAAGNVAVTGLVTDGFDDDMKTVKYAAADGAVIWEKTFDSGGGNDDHGFAVAIDGAGNVIVTGESNNGFTFDWITIKYAAADGAIVWQKPFRLDVPEAGDDVGYSIAIDGANNVFVAGSGHNGANLDWHTIKYAAADGAVLWEKTYAGAGGGDDIGYSVALDAAGNAIVTGFSNNGADNDWKTIKYAAADGAILWEKSFAGANGSDVSTTVAIDAAGNAIVAGRTNNFPNRDMKVIKYAAADGALIWQYTYNGTANDFDRVAAVAVLPDAVILAGESTETGLPTGWRIVKLGADVASDTAPDAFAFAAQLGVPLASVRTSNTVTPAGYDAPAPIGVTGGTYSIGCTVTFTATAGTINPGDSVCVRHTSASANGASVTTTLTIGGVPATFTSTTLLDPAADTDGDGIPNGVEVTEGRNPLVKDNDLFTSNRLFAMQQYRDFLGREGAAAEITFYTNLLTNGPAVRANVIENFFNSPEFQGVGSPVARLYFATFLRIPDYPGLIFQINAFRAGTPLPVIANNFTASPEFVATYGALNSSQFVALLYTNILGRTPAQAEVDFHVARLVGGATRGEVLVGFSESPEFKARIGNEVYVTMMYAGMLRRAPEPAGFSFWLAYMDAGNSGLALILGFLNAPEYHNRFLP